MSDQSEQSHITVVDSTNFNQFVDEKLNPAPSPEAAAAAELEKVEKEKGERLAAEESAKKSDDDPTHDVEMPSEKRKEVTERLSKLAKQRKEAEAKAEKSAQEAAEIRAENERLRAESEALKAKYEPPAKPSAEPLEEQFASKAEFLKARDHWAGEKALRDAAEKTAKEAEGKATEAIRKGWQERFDAYKAQNPDFEAKLDKAQVKVSNQVRDAIIKSDVGPQILNHLAENPDFGESLGKMTVDEALIELGGLRRELKGAGQAGTKSEEKAPVSVSKAPAPITPLKGASGVHPKLKGSDPVPANWDYDRWAEAYRRGDIV